MFDLSFLFHSGSIHDCLSSLVPEIHFSKLLECSANQDISKHHKSRVPDENGVSQAC